MERIVLSQLDNFSIDQRSMNKTKLELRFVVLKFEFHKGKAGQESNMEEEKKRFIMNEFNVRNMNDEEE